MLIAIAQPVQAHHIAASDRDLCCRCLRCCCYRCHSIAASELWDKLPDVWIRRSGFRVNVVSNARRLPRWDVLFYAQLKKDSSTEQPSGFFLGGLFEVKSRERVEPLWVMYAATHRFRLLYKGRWMREDDLSAATAQIQYNNTPHRRAISLHVCNSTYPVSRGSSNRQPAAHRGRSQFIFNSFPSFQKNL